MKPAALQCQRYREVRAIYKRQHEIYEIQSNLGYTKLDVPIRHGWYKEIVLTRRVERYKHKAVILSIFERLNTSHWGRTKDLASRKWDAQVSKYLIVNDVPTISKKQFNKLTIKEQSLCVPFQFYKEKYKKVTRFYIKLPKSAYRIKFTKAYNTHKKNIDPLLDQELNELETRLLQPGMYEADKKQSRYKDDWDQKSFKKRSYINQSLKRLSQHKIEDLINDNISWEIIN